jgi:hypothetical protein
MPSLTVNGKTINYTYSRTEAVTDSGLKTKESTLKVGSAKYVFHPDAISRQTENQCVTYVRAFEALMPNRGVNLKISTPLHSLSNSQIRNIAREHARGFLPTPTQQAESSTQAQSRAFVPVPSGRGEDGTKEYEMNGVQSTVVDANDGKRYYGYNQAWHSNPPAQSPESSMQTELQAFRIKSPLSGNVTGGLQRANTDMEALLGAKTSLENKLFREPSGSYSGDLAHYMMGFKVGLLPIGPNEVKEDFARCFEAYEKIHGEHHATTSLKLAGYGDPENPADVSIYLSDANFEKLVNADIDEYSKKYFDGERNPGRMLRKLKSQEPVELKPGLEGRILTYGGDNADKWEEIYEESVQNSECEYDFLPWSKSTDLLEKDPEFRLISPPAYNCWPSEENTQLRKRYRLANQQITQALLSRHGYTEMPELGSPELESLRRAVAKDFIDTLFPVNG